MSSSDPTLVNDTSHQHILSCVVSLLNIFLCVSNIHLHVCVCCKQVSSTSSAKVQIPPSFLE